MMPTCPGQNTRSPRSSPSKFAADRYVAAELGLLHVAVARAVEARHLHGHLHQARAVEAQAGLAAPQVGRADETLGDGDEVGRMPRSSAMWRIGTKLPSASLAKDGPSLGDAEHRVHAERQPGRRL